MGLHDPHKWDNQSIGPHRQTPKIRPRWLKFPLDILTEFEYTAIMETQVEKIKMPTDDDDCAAWAMSLNKDNVRFISSKELEALPEFITETINIGQVASTNGQIYSPSLEQFTGVK